MAALLLTAFVEPLVAHWSARARIFAGAFLFAVNLGILLVVFNQRWERWLAFALVIPVLASTIVHATRSDWASFAAVAYHCFAFLFLAFAVAVILMRIFHHQGTIRIDTVIGALCGYLLAAAAWGNVYALVYLFRPEAFRIAEDVIASHFSDWNLQRFFFGLL